jgi:hypothetical protein
MRHVDLGVCGVTQLPVIAPCLSASRLAWLRNFTVQAWQPDPIGRKRMAANRIIRWSTAGAMAGVAAVATVTS